MVEMYQEISKKLNQATTYLTLGDTAHAKGIIEEVESVLPSLIPQGRTRNKFHRRVNSLKEKMNAGPSKAVMEYEIKAQMNLKYKSALDNIKTSNYEGALRLLAEVSEISKKTKIDLPDGYKTTLKNALTLSGEIRPIRSTPGFQPVYNPNAPTGMDVVKKSYINTQSKKLESIIA